MVFRTKPRFDKLALKRCPKCRHEVKNLCPECRTCESCCTCRKKEEREGAFVN